MNRLRLFVVVISALVFFPAYVAADDYSKAAKVFRDSPVVAPYFKNSYGYAVFPTIGKGGIGIGGAHGSGQVYAGGKLTGKSSMTQLTIGFQLGGQAYSQIIFFKDKRAYNEFTSGNFEFGAQASAVAITAGAQAQTGTTGAGASASPGGSAGSQAKTDYHKGMAVFTRAKGGLMYEAAIGGQKFSFEPIGK
ncbi:MAG: YSC84-related protein [Gammaproteobacteria bacterium]|nr:YSC84-related protein [Gammaproteobacteria bacterium]